MAALLVLLSLFFFFFFFLIQEGQGGGLKTTSSSNDQNIDEQCKPETCGHVRVRFPFRLKGKHPKHCGYPGFDLYCSPHYNQPILNLPLYSSSSGVIIDHIDYEDQLLHAHYLDDCLWTENLNWSASIFQFQPQLDEDIQYYVMSCPKASSSAILNYSRLRYHHNCKSESTLRVYIPISFYYLPLWPCKFISGPLYGRDRLKLGWSKPMCGECESRQGLCRRRKNNSELGLETECYGGKEPPTTHKLVRFDAKENNNGTGFNSIKNIIIRGCIITSLILLVGVLVMYLDHRKNQNTKQGQLKIEKFLQDYKALKPSRYSYADIKKVTNNFIDMIGQGGYGVVYKGKLSNDVLVAVKILNDAKENGDEFINEVGTMGKIHHVNVVRLVGYCADGVKRALVYEFMQNKSLEKIVSAEGRKKLLIGWKKLEEIALGIAKGLQYLHQGCDQRILHFDIKPHNVLLDSNFLPKISDFGLAKLCSKEQSAISMTIARGTIGYIAPEVFSRNFGNVSYKSDIYSFGMLLLDMVGGRKNNNTLDEDKSDAYFPQWIYNRLDRGEELEIQTELHEADENSKRIIKKLTIVGLWCIQWYPSNRPSMKVVLQMLEGDGNELTLPPYPFASTDPTADKGTVGRTRGTFTSSLEIISESE